MGTSFLTPAQKEPLNNIFNNLHATFMRPITVYKTAQETVVVSNSENNWLFQQAPFNSVMDTVQQSGVFGARILYAKKENLVPFSVDSTRSDTQNMIRLSEGDVRLKLDPTGAAFLAGCERVTFDGTIFNVITDKRPHGLFTPNFETFFLKKIQ